jgi:hypothetical protein
MTYLDARRLAAVSPSRRFARICLALSEALLLLAAPTSARADGPELPLDTPQPSADDTCPPAGGVPLGYRCDLRPAFRGLMISGGVVSGLGYTLNLVTMAANHGADPVAALPVFGSFIAAATHRPPPPPMPTASMDFNFNVDLSVPVYIAAGVVQTAGAALMLTSLAVRKPLLVKIPDTAFTLRPAPYVGAQGGGVGLLGTF